MLVMSLKVGRSIIIGDDITVTAVSIHGDTVRFVVNGESKSIAADKPIEKKQPRTIKLQKNNRPVLSLKRNS